MQSYTVGDLILFGGHSDLYIMVQRFCLVSLTIFNRKTSYRSLKQTAGSTSCPWTTILVVLIHGCLSFKFAILCGINLPIALSSSEKMFFPKLFYWRRDVKFLNQTITEVISWMSLKPCVCVCVFQFS